MTMPTRTLPVTGARNLRDLGGYTTAEGRTVRPGRLLRSAELQNLTPADQDYLRERVAVIADLRTSDERTTAPTPDIEGVRNVHLPVFEQKGHDNNITRAVAAAAKGELEEAPMLDVNREFVTSEQASKAYRDLIEHILEVPEDKAVLWHCTAGKDRTGMAAVILLTVLGVDEETILHDYMATNEHLAEHVENIVNAIEDKTEAEVIRSFWIARPDYLEAAFDEMRVRFGSVDNYLREALGLDDEKRAALRAALLD